MTILLIGILLTYCNPDSKGGGMRRIIVISASKTKNNRKSEIIVVVGAREEIVWIKWRERVTFPTVYKLSRVIIIVSTYKWFYVLFER